MPTTPPPSTPTGQVITTTPHTGTWQHPRLDEIVDNLADIPLTPGQRKLLGLHPLSDVPTLSSEYSTPPKYARTSTPLSGSPNSIERNSGFSPGKESPLLGSLHGSPLSRMGRLGAGNSQRSSFGSSALSTNPKLVYDTPGTPTPNVSKGGVNLNSKWLYDKGRRNSMTLRSYT